MKKTKSLYHGHRFPGAVISLAVRCYFRFQLSLRDIDVSLFERGVVVSYETILRCWCDKFGANFSHRDKAARRKPCSTWHLDQVFVTLRGESWLLWRAVDEHGAELDILLQKRRDKAEAKRFFQRVLRACPAPHKIVTDQPRASLYRKHLTARFSAWREFSEVTKNRPLLSEQMPPRPPGYLESANLTGPSSFIGIDRRRDFVA